MESLAPIQLVEEQRLGSVDDPDVGFSQISGVAVSSSGLVLVLDGRDRTVKVYDSLGTALRRIGGPGEGPGEFTSPVELGIRNDTLWVRDGRARRISLFTLSGEFIGSVSTRGVVLAIPEAPGAEVRLMPIAPMPGLLFASGVSLNLVDPAHVPDSFAVPNLLFDITGQVADTVGVHMMRPHQGSDGVVGQGIAFTNPLNARPLGGRHDGDTIIILRPVSHTSDLARLSVTRLDSAGDTVYFTNIQYRPRPVTDSIRAALSPIGTFEMAVREGYAPPSQSEEARRVIDSLFATVPYMPPVDRH
jgi:hypothetical protein